ncbi:sugar kinase [Paenibacillus humicola]|uniref:sugar kinase n=1 Tax=Paenibacillus humicola TaxID=3110540 RepID=UPI00237C2C71|nr:sugar kinase [Paenibacillus humicola]
MKVITIGELLVEIMRTETNRPLSEPAPFAGPYPSGAPAIFIDALAKLGFATGIAGAVGDDAFGRCLTERLRQDGVDCAHIYRLEAKTTGIAFVTYSDDGSREFLFHMKDSAAVEVPERPEPDFLQGAVALHVSGTSLTSSESLRTLIYEAVRAVKREGGVITFDPNLRPELAGERSWAEWYEPVLRETDILLPSGEELEWLTGCPGPEEAAVRLAQRGIGLIVRKMGAGGCELYENGKRTAAAPGFSVECIDPTGAGDCFSAGVVYGYLSSWPWERTLRLANALGALSTTKLGPMEGTQNLQTVLDFMNDH